MRKISKAIPIAILMALATISVGDSSASGALDDTGARIEKLRTREVRIHLLDDNGAPVQAASVTAGMIRHRFLFGCNFYMYEKFDTAEQNERYKKMWIGLFNYGTVPFYFGQYQHSSNPDDSEKKRVKEMTAWLLDRGAVVKGHPLIWHFPSVSPDWLPENPEETGRIIEDWIKSVVKQYPEIKFWDVLNEPTTIWFYDTKTAKWEQSVGAIETARKGIAWTRASAPNAGLIINDYNVKLALWSFMPLFKPARLIGLAFDRAKQYPYSYRRYLEDLKKSGAQFDAVGLQSHMHMGNWSMNTVWRTCERYAKLGLPLHFTELTVLSGANKIMQPHDPQKNLPWPGTPEGERKQAEYVADLYTLLFSHPSVEAITWWDIADHEAWMGAPAGLLRDDLSPKPAYERLRHLIREQWWTRATGATDENGYFAFRGFCGDYELTIDGAAKRMPFSIDCSAPENRVIEMELAR